MELDFKGAVEHVMKQKDQHKRKKAIRIHSYGSKIDTMKEELPVLKEIAKLLFEINENLKEN